MVWPSILPVTNMATDPVIREVLSMTRTVTVEEDFGILRAGAGLGLTRYV